MKEYKYELKLVGEIPKGMELKKTFTYTSQQEWNGYSYGSAVGRIYDDGSIESFLGHDRELGYPEWFELLRKSGSLYSRQRCIIDRETYHERNCEEFYLIYRIVGHKSDLPTHTLFPMDTCINVSFKCTYEILLVADDEHRSYIYETFETEGPCTYSLLDAIEHLEAQFEAWAYEGKNGFSLGNGEGLYAEFYTPYGSSAKLEFESMYALLMCIHSIRMVHLERSVKERN